ncbi:psp operon transcriptional activator [Vibrio sp. JCM 19236]|nr:psp operon transcriptional activator [Vibrio sp. JCM 19236]
MANQMKEQSLLGQSANFLSVLDKVSRLAPINRPVLIIGERGTGKELIARRLHYLSKRWDKPLININCATLSEGVVDSELFGHEAGSFTGAKGRHQGRFERAEGGTLFLDELATAPLFVQEKLLRVIEYGEYERVGGTRSLDCDVRLICATNANLPELAQKGEFRADLLDRLAFDVLLLPPLRERQQDIPLLAEHFAMKMCQELGYELFAGFSEKCHQSLLSYPWPGNVRELKNVVERAIYQNPNPISPIEELVFNPFANHAEPKIEVKESHWSLPLDYKEWQQQQDTQMLNQALTEAQHNQKRAAQLLGLSYHQFRGMLRKYKMV